MSSKLANGGDRLQTLRSHFKALNSQFASWVQEQARDCPGEDWSDGVQDYLNYRKQLVSEFADCIDADKNQGAPAPASTVAPPTTTAAPVHPIFSMAASSKPAPSAAGLFGSAPTSTASAPGAEPKATGLFGQPAAAPTSLAPPTNTFGGSNEGDEDEGPSQADQANYKPEVQADESAGAILFKAKAKALILNNKTWDKKAMGLLTVRKPPSGRPFVTIGTDAGRSLLTATIPPNAKIMANTSNSKIYGIYFSGAYTIPEGDAGQKAHQGNIMFQVTPDKGPELKAQLDKIAAS